LPAAIWPFISLTIALILQIPTVYSVHFLPVIRYFQIEHYKTISGNFPEKQIRTEPIPVLDFLTLNANFCDYKSL
jgi:hypothetical protein